MKKLATIILLLFLLVCVMAQSGNEIANFLRPTTALPATCMPYSVRSSSAGVSICNAAGTGWNLAAAASGGVTILTGSASLDYGATAAGFQSTPFLIERANSDLVRCQCTAY